MRAMRITIVALLLAWAGPAGEPIALAAPSKTRGTVSVVNLDGLQKSMKKSRGRAVLLHLWATWCLPCLDELPIIDQFAREMKACGLDVLSVSLDDPATQGSKVSRTLRDLAPHLNATIVQVDDMNAFIDAIDSQWQGSIPAVFAYDQKGALRGSYIGEASRKQLDGLVGALLPPGSKATCSATRPPARRGRT